MKYTVYIFKCLSTGTHCMGVTRDLRERLQELRQGAGWRPLAHPELLHVEQHDDLEHAHRRLQAIRRRWGHQSVWPTFLTPDPLVVTSIVIGWGSPH